jgi:hypothetical protein
VLRQALGVAAPPGAGVLVTPRGAVRRSPVLAAGEGKQFGGAEFMTEPALGVSDLDEELLEPGG